MASAPPNLDLLLFPGISNGGPTSSFPQRATQVQLRIKIYERVWVNSVKCIQNSIVGQQEAKLPPEVLVRFFYVCTNRWKSQNRVCPESIFWN